MVLWLELEEREGKEGKWLELRIWTCLIMLW